MTGNRDQPVSSNIEGEPSRIVNNFSGELMQHYSPALVTSEAAQSNGLVMESQEGNEVERIDRHLESIAITATDPSSNSSASVVAGLGSTIPPTQPPSNKTHPPVDEEWLLKSIHWPPLPPSPSDYVDTRPSDRMKTRGMIRIILQNGNGPCSLLALCNILILRSDIIITPPQRHSVSYNYLSQLIADYLLRRLSALPPSSSSLDLAAVLEILPTTRYGLTLNPRFGSIDGFKPSSSTNDENGTEDELNKTGELALFALAGVDLRHGWVASPDEGELFDLLVEKCGDYDEAVMMMIKGNEIAGDVIDDNRNDEEMIKAVERRSRWTKNEEKIVQEAHMIGQFLSSNQTQLTYHGLSLLNSQLASGSLTALFRNSHLSVLYRRPASSSPQIFSAPELFTLVTDSTFLNEGNIVWESLEDVDGSASDFFDAGLSRCTGAASGSGGGDYVGRERRTESGIETSIQSTTDPDFALAQQLQHDEDDRFNARQDELASRREGDQIRNALPELYSDTPNRTNLSDQDNRMGAARKTSETQKKPKKSKDCLIM